MVIVVYLYLYFSTLIFDHHAPSIMYAVVPAAGCGIRLDSHPQGSSKSLIEIYPNQSLLERTLRSIVEVDLCKGIVVAARSSDEDEIFKILKRVEKKTLESFVVRGGSTRQESVFECLKKVQGKAEWVMVHDAARPFCSPEYMKAVAEEARISGAAILATPISPTLKQVDVKECVIMKTLPRQAIWAAQTPQVFSYRLFFEAHQRALEEEYEGTDDSELVERIGTQVKIVRGSEINFKITTQADLYMARKLLS